MFDLPPGFWDEPMTEPPGEPARAAQPAPRAARSAPGADADQAGAADSPLALVQQLFPGRIVNIERPEAADAELLAADEPAFSEDDGLPPDD